MFIEWLNSNKKTSKNFDNNAKLRQEAQNNSEKYFFKLTSNAVFVKAMENVGKYRNIKLVTQKRKEIN